MPRTSAPRHPRFADLDVSDSVRAHLVGIAFKYREIRFLALFKRAEAVALPNLASGVDRHGADCIVKRNGLIGRSISGRVAKPFARCLASPGGPSGAADLFCLNENPLGVDILSSALNNVEGAKLVSIGELETMLKTLVARVDDVASGKQVDQRDIMGITTAPGQPCRLTRRRQGGIETQTSQKQRVFVRFWMPRTIFVPNALLCDARNSAVRTACRCI